MAELYLTLNSFVKLFRNPCVAFTTCHWDTNFTASKGQGVSKNTLQNNIHKDTQLDDGHGGDLNDLSYLLCFLIWELKQSVRSPYDLRSLLLAKLSSAMEW